jgi:hypothetical protein
MKSSTKGLSLLAAGATAITLSLSGCGGQPTVVPPMAYGEFYGGVGHCYYANSLYEATMLLSGHYCPAGWIPTPMPLLWHERYYPYYSSQRYMVIAVPHNSWGTYRTSQSTFGKTYKVAIKTQTRTAKTYRPVGVTVTKRTTTTTRTKSNTGNSSSTKTSTRTSVGQRTSSNRGGGYTGRTSTGGGTRRR